LYRFENLSMWFTPLCRNTRKRHLSYPHTILKTWIIGFRYDLLEE